jgi:hypothetical protein
MQRGQVAGQSLLGSLGRWSAGVARAGGVDDGIRLVADGQGALANAGGRRYLTLAGSLGG